MKAIILAAGQSTRLYPLTKQRPKSLLDIGGINIIEYQISALKEEGINNIVIITGCLSKQFDYLKNEAGVKLIHNPKYAQTNNLYSLWYARHELSGGSCLCLHADLVFHLNILKNCINTSMDLGLLVDKRVDRETMRVKIDADKVIDVGKEVAYEGASGTFIGMAKFSPRGAENFVKEMEEIINRNNNKDAYFTIVFRSLINKGIPIGCCYTNGYPWIEVDTLQDLERLRKEVYPQIRDYSR